MILLVSLHRIRSRVKERNGWYKAAYLSNAMVNSKNKMRSSTSKNIKCPLSSWQLCSDLTRCWKTMGHDFRILFKNLNSIFKLRCQILKPRFVSTKGLKAKKSYDTIYLVHVSLAGACFTSSSVLLDQWTFLWPYFCP